MAVLTSLSAWSTSARRKGESWAGRSGTMRFVAEDGVNPARAPNRPTNVLNEADGRPNRWTARQPKVHAGPGNSEIGQADAGIPLDLYTQRASAIRAEALGLPAPGAGRGLRAADNGGVAGQAGPEGPGVGPPRAAEGSGGGGWSAPGPRDGAGAAPPPEPPKGNGAGGRSDVDWGVVSPRCPKADSAIIA